MIFIMLLDALSLMILQITIPSQKFSKGAIFFTLLTQFQKVLCLIQDNRLTSSLKNTFGSYIFQQLVSKSLSIHGHLNLLKE